MAEVSGQQTATDGAPRLASINYMDLMFGAQRLMLAEIAFAGNEWIDRTRTETHLLSEFISKLAGTHSVHGLRTMYEECGLHQVNFIRRDCARVFRHGKRMIEASSRLFNGGPGA